MSITVLIQYSSNQSIYIDSVLTGVYGWYESELSVGSHPDMQGNQNPSGLSQQFVSSPTALQGRVTTEYSCLFILEIV